MGRGTAPTMAVNRDNVMEGEASGAFTQKSNKGDTWASTEGIRRFKCNASC